MKQRNKQHKNQPSLYQATEDLPLFTVPEEPAPPEPFQVGDKVTVGGQRGRIQLLAGEGIIQDIHPTTTGNVRYDVYMGETYGVQSYYQGELIS